MTTWIYLSSPSGVGVVPTFELAQNQNIIVRAFYKDKDDRLECVSQARKIREGHCLFLAFIKEGRIDKAESLTLVSSHGEFTSEAQQGVDGTPRLGSGS